VVSYKFVSYKKRVCGMLSKRFFFNYWKGVID